MNFSEQYKVNKPLFNSILMGLFYLVFSWFSINSHTITQLFLMTMLFLPGITFPLSTCYYHSKTNTVSRYQKWIHFICSVGIYYGSCWVFTKFEIIYQIAAGMIGAFFFLITTKYILNKNIPFMHIFIGIILGGISFLPNIIYKTRINIGIELFLWTVFIGYIINLEFKSMKPLFGSAQNTPNVLRHFL